MAKVFSWDDIRRGKIPTLDNFDIAQQMLMVGLEELLERGIIVGGRIYGSMARREFTRLSDIDLLLILESSNEGNSDKILRDLYKLIFDQTFVRVEANHTYKEDAEKGLHASSMFYLKHFEHIPLEGNIVGTDPLKIFSSAFLESGIQPLSDYQVLVSYLISKLKKFSEGLIAFDEKEWQLALQRSLELPSNVARIILKYFEEKSEFKFDQDCDGKKTVIRNWRMFSETNNLNDLKDYELLLNAGVRYRELFESTLLLVESSSPFTEIKQIELDYKNELANLRDKCLPIAHSWTKGMLTFLEKKEYKKENMAGIEKK